MFAASRADWYNFSGGVFASFGELSVSLEVEATYENGVLKPDKPLPLGERQRNTVASKRRPVRSAKRRDDRPAQQSGSHRLPHGVQKTSPGKTHELFRHLRGGCGFPRRQHIRLSLHLRTNARARPATALLERLERREVEGWVSPHVLAETSHRLMTIEACSAFGWPYQGIASRLRRHPEHIQQFADSAKRWRGRSPQAPNGRRDRSACNASRRPESQHGLLTNDALLLAAMQSRGLTNLESNDADFDRIPGISRFAPV